MTTLLTTGFIAYTAAMLMWLVLVGQGARLEPGLGERFIRPSGWPDRVMVVGLVWTARLALCVLASVRESQHHRVRTLVVLCVAVGAVAFVTPRWFGSLGYFGVSTGEFMDALFPLLGGLLPGGQATIGLRVVLVALVAWTLGTIVLRSRAARAAGSAANLERGTL